MILHLISVTFRIILKNSLQSVGILCICVCYYGCIVVLWHNAECKWVYVLDLVFFCMVLTANNLGNLCYMLSDMLMLKSVINLKVKQHYLCTNYKTKSCYYLDISPSVDLWCWSTHNSVWIPTWHNLKIIFWKIEHA